MEPRHVILQPTDELSLHNLGWRRKRLKTKQESCKIAAAATITIGICALVLGLPNQSDETPLSSWVLPCEVLVGLALLLQMQIFCYLMSKRRRVSRERQRLSERARPCTLDDPELQQLAARLDETCKVVDGSCTEPERIGIFQARFDAYMLLLEIQEGMRPAADFTETFAGVRRICDAVSQAQQRRALAK